MNCVFLVCILNIEFFSWIAYSVFYVFIMYVICNCTTSWIVRIQFLNNVFIFIYIGIGILLSFFLFMLYNIFLHLYLCALFYLRSHCMPAVRFLNSIVPIYPCGCGRRALFEVALMSTRRCNDSYWSTDNVRIFSYPYP